MVGRVVVGVVGCGVDRKNWLSEFRDMDHEYVTGPVTGRRLLGVLALQGLVRGGSGARCGVEGAALVCSSVTGT